MKTFLTVFIILNLTFVCHVKLISTDISASFSIPIGITENNNDSDIHEDIFFDNKHSISNFQKCRNRIIANKTSFTLSYFNSIWRPPEF